MSRPDVLDGLAEHPDPIGVARPEQAFQQLRYGSMQVSVVSSSQPSMVSSIIALE